MQGEHWILIANILHNLHFADSFGFFKQQYKQMMPEPLQSHPSVCGLYTIYATFHLFEFRQEGNTGVPDDNVLSFIIKSM